MGDLEFFGGLDTGGESFDPAAFERFKERMKRAAAQLKAQQKTEQKQKKTEDELIKILIKFIKSGKKKDQLILVTRLLEMNVPAGFIVALLLISNAEIREELKINLLPSAVKEIQQGVVEESFSDDNSLPDVYIGGEVLPLKIKIAIANWINEITKKANDHPHKVIKTLLDDEEVIQLSAVQLGAFCLRDFLEQNQIAFKYEQIKDFVSFFLSDIIKKTAKDLKNRKELKDGQ